jgi:hypothetical protein
MGNFCSGAVESTRAKWEELMSLNDEDLGLLGQFVDCVRRTDRNKQTLESLHEAGLSLDDPWYIVSQVTDSSELRILYDVLPAPFPALFEKFVLNYRWSELDLGVCRLLPNEVGSSLMPLRSAIMNDQGIYGVALPNGVIPFGKGPGISYDPVCFDVRTSGARRDDYPVVQLDHEELLCNERVVIVERVAPSFRELVNVVVGRTA